MIYTKIPIFMLTIYIDPIIIAQPRQNDAGASVCKSILKHKSPISPYYGGLPFIGILRENYGEVKVGGKYVRNC